MRPRSAAPTRRLIGALERGRDAFDRGIDWLFEGCVASWVYAALRIGLAALLLVRHADWLRPWVFLEHHRFVRGLMFLDTQPLEPRLSSPLIPGLTLGEASTHALVYARTALAVLLLLGVRARASAALLALASYALLASDRYRYYHHLQLLYVGIAWLALAPIGASWSVERLARRAWDVVRGRGSNAPTAVTTASFDSPLWPLQLIRALVLSVYAAAGVSKLESGWLSGEVLRHLERFHVLSGVVWETARNLVGYAGVAKLACVTELLLPIVLALKPTRRLAIVMGFAFHAGISACMPVYTFGAQMSVLLIAFWPVARREAAPRFIGGDRRH